MGRLCLHEKHSTEVGLMLCLGTDPSLCPYSGRRMTQ